MRRKLKRTPAEAHRCDSISQGYWFRKSARCTFAATVSIVRESARQGCGEHTITTKASKHCQRHAQKVALSALLLCQHVIAKRIITVDLED